MPCGSSNVHINTNFFFLDVEQNTIFFKEREGLNIFFPKTFLKVRGFIYEKSSSSYL